MDINSKSGSGLGTLPGYTFMPNLKIYYIHHYLRNRFLTKGNITSRVSTISTKKCQDTWAIGILYTKRCKVFVDNFKTYGTV